jgi:hypothetical protein
VRWWPEIEKSRRMTMKRTLQQLFQHSVILTAVFLVGVACLVSPASFGQEYVTVKQDGTGDYITIQAALDDMMREYDDIVVFPGRYEENIHITGSVKLRAYEGPYLTCIDGQLQTPHLDVVTVAENLPDVEIIGFTVTNGRYGIHVGNSSHVLISNCVAYQNTSHGLYSYWDGSTSITILLLYNSVSVNNGGCGYYMRAHEALNQIGNYRRHAHFATLYNSILVQNTGNGIAYNAGSSDSYFTERYIIDSCNIWGNTAGNYGTNLGPGSNVVPTNTISENPRFVGQTAGPGFDARLQSTSPCRNAGRPGAAWLDPDGTRNDMGAFGGPRAQNFFESPTDGPIVREVRVSPGSVPQGETITIEATAAVR